jgi:hypothetical protein
VADAVVVDEVVLHAVHVAHKGGHVPLKVVLPHNVDGRYDTGNDDDNDAHGHGAGDAFALGLVGVDSVLETQKFDPYESGQGDKDAVDKMVFMNKCDLTEERCIKKDEIDKFEKENGIKVLEVSAKTGEGIDKGFEYIIEKLIDKNDNKNSNTLTLKGEGLLGNKDGCC